MTTPPFDLNAAMDAAAEHDTNALHIAAGRVGNALHGLVIGLVQSPEGTANSKIVFLDQLSERVSTDGLKALVGHSSTRPLGSSSSTDEDNDLKDQLEKANVQVTTLTKDRKALERIVSERGLTTPTDTNTPFPDDIVKRVSDRVKEEIKDAKDAATPADVVSKADMVTLVKAVEDAIANLGTGMMTSKIDGLDDLVDAVDAAKSAVS